MFLYLVFLLVYLFLYGYSVVTVLNRVWLSHGQPRRKEKIRCCVRSKSEFAEVLLHRELTVSRSHAFKTQWAECKQKQRVGFWKEWAGPFKLFIVVYDTLILFSYFCVCVCYFSSLVKVGIPLHCVVARVLANICENWVWVTSVLRVSVYFSVSSTVLGRNV